jgi:hypothetical protein
VTELDGTQSIWLWDYLKPIIRADSTLAALVPGGWFFMADPRAPQPSTPAVYPSGRFNVLSDQTLWGVGPLPYGGTITFNVVITLKNQDITLVKSPLSRLYTLLHDTGFILGNGLRASLFMDMPDVPFYDRREAETTFYYTMGVRYVAEIEPT